MQDQPVIDVSVLGEGMTALTPAMGRVLAEAAAICLDHAGHTPKAVLVVLNDSEREFLLDWPPVSDQMRRTFADLQEATQFGACAVSIVLVKVMIGFEVLERSWIGTGFDYWVGNEGDGLPFDNMARLEVSGILNGNHTDVKSRVKQKVKQVSVSDNLKIPAIVSVVEFGKPIAKVVHP